MEKAKISERTSLLAIVKKAYEGALTEPSAGSQYFETQSDFSGIQPNFQNVPDPAIKQDIMASGTIRSGEEPSTSFSHTMKGSGTPGIAPNFGTLFESSFGGKRGQTTETSIRTGNTASELVVNSSDIGKFAKGDLVRLYSSGLDTETSELVAIESVDTAANKLKLAYNLVSIPADADVSKYKIGAFTTYTPLNVNLPVLDCWHYLEYGDAGYESMTDGRTTAITITCTAAEVINANFTIEGTAFDFNNVNFYRLNVVAGKNQLKLTPYKGSAAGTQQTVSVAAGRQSVVTIARRLQTAIRAITLAGHDFSNVEVDYDDSINRFVFSYGSGGNNVTGFKFDPQTALNEETFFKQLGFTAVLAGTDNASKDQSPQGDVTTATYSSVVDPDYNETGAVVGLDQTLYIGHEKYNNVKIKSPTVSFNINTPKTLMKSFSTKSGNDGSTVNERTATMSVQAYLEHNDHRFFEPFKKDEPISFLYAGGKKVEKDQADVWVGGETYGIYGSSAKINNHTLTKVNQAYAIDMEITCFSSGDGKGDIFCGFQ